MDHRLFEISGWNRHGMCRPLRTNSTWPSTGGTKGQERREEREKENGPQVI